MLTSIISLGLLLVMTDMTQAEYVLRPEIEGWIKVHHIAETWKDAYRKCQSEEYAILTSPNTLELRNVMTELFDDRNTSYFIGTTSMFYPGPNFRSIEGVSIEDMNVTDMFGGLDSERGQCLAMDLYTIREVSCTARLPYLCYKKQKEEIIKVSECGTTAQGYTLDTTTGSCYKLHVDRLTWDKAYLACAEEGAHLVVINDEVEARILFRKTGSLTATKGNYFVWIGNAIRNGDGGWISIHGHRLEDIYNVWLERQPTQLSHEEATSGYCGGIYFIGPLHFDFCDNIRPFLCEKDPSKTLFSNEV